MQSENFNILKMSNAEKKDFRKKKIEKFKKSPLKTTKKGCCCYFYCIGGGRKKFLNWILIKLSRKVFFIMNLSGIHESHPTTSTYISIYFLFYIIDLKIWGKLYPKNIHSRKTTTSIHPPFILGCRYLYCTYCMHIFVELVLSSDQTVKVILKSQIFWQEGFTNIIIRYFDKIQWYSVINIR